MQEHVSPNPTTSDSLDSYYWETDYWKDETTDRSSSLSESPDHSTNGSLTGNLNKVSSIGAQEIDDREDFKRDQHSSLSGSLSLGLRIRATSWSEGRDSSRMSVSSFTSGISLTQSSEVTPQRTSLSSISSSVKAHR